MSRLFACLFVGIKPEKVYSASPCEGSKPPESDHTQAEYTTHVTGQMLLYLYVNLRLLNKLTSEMGDFLTDAMRDSNSHEFEEIVDPITCIPNEELEESLDEIDETLSGKEASVTTAFSWANVSSQNRCGPTKRQKIDGTVATVVVIDSSPANPEKKD